MWWQAILSNERYFTCVKFELLKAQVKRSALKFDAKQRVKLVLTHLRSISLGFLLLTYSSISSSSNVLMISV